MKFLPNFRDNAMLFKDITQWLRRKTFLVLFIGLLLLSNLLSVFIMSLPNLEPGQSGLTTFALLGGLLFLYMEVIALMTQGLTASEFGNGTFELFELSGMTLERMIRGKLFSAFAEFLFGFFAIIPFMFFAYLQGGIDFYLIFALILLLFFIAPLLFALSLMIAVLSRVKSVSRLLKIAGGIGIFFLGCGVCVEVSVICEGNLSRTLIGGPMVNLVKQLMARNSDAWWGLLVFMLFYLQVFLLIFYVSCNAISPPSDTRQSQVKALITLIGASWVGLFIWLFKVNGPESEIYYMVTISVLIVAGIMGLGIFYGTGRVPAMARIRLIKSGPVRKLFYYWFAPNSAGTFRSILLIWLFILVFKMGITYLANASGDPGMWSLNDLENATSMALQLPFFLGFPAILIILSANNRAAPYKQRMLVFTWWLILGLAAVITMMTASEGMSTFASPTARVSEALGLFVSPISTCFSGGSPGSLLFQNAPDIRFALGVFGFFLMGVYLFVQKRHLRDTAISMNAASDSDDASRSLPVIEEPVAMGDEEEEKRRKTMGSTE